MSRAAVYSLTKNDPIIGTLIKDVQAFAAVDTPRKAERPFIVIKWGNTAPGAVRSRGPVPVTFWVYDTSRDYAVITAVIERLKAVMADAIHVVGEDGWTLSQAQWESESEDLYDDIYECIVRTVTFTIVTRPS